MRSFTSLLFGAGLLIGSAHAQELIGIQIEPAEVAVGKPVQITVQFKSLGVVNGACGLMVNFGDGTSEHVRAEENNLPVRFTRTYNREGPLTVTAEGKTLFRGISTVFLCLGRNQAAAINVRGENYAEKRAAELAAEKAAKEAAIRRAEIDRVAAQHAALAAQQQLPPRIKPPPPPAPAPKKVLPPSARPPAAAEPAPASVPAPPPKPTAPKARSAMDL